MRSLRYGGIAAHLPVLIVLLLGCSAVFGQDTANLLPVTEAYKLSADASTAGVVKLHWTIAQDYYLYRGRMNFKAGDGVTLGTPQLPDGEKHVDQYLGPVETYHHSIDATIPYTLAPGTTHLTLSVRYQGCHETDPKICYPPHTEQLDLPVPTATGATNKLSNLLNSPPQSLDRQQQCSITCRAGLPFRRDRTGSPSPAAALDDAQGLLPVSRPDDAVVEGRAATLTVARVASRNDAPGCAFRQHHGVLR